MYIGTYEFANIKIVCKHFIITRCIQFISLQVSIIYYIFN